MEKSASEKFSPSVTLLEKLDGGPLSLKATAFHLGLKEMIENSLISIAAIGVVAFQLFVMTDISMLKRVSQIHWIS